MRVELNLAQAESPRERYALAWAVPALVLGLAGLALLGRSATRELRSFRNVHASLVKLEEQDRSLRERETSLRRDLEQPQFREIYRQVQFVNGLIEKKSLAATELAARVTKLLPDGARLAGLTLLQRDEQMTVRFTIHAKSVEAVESFVSNLEDSPDFKDPVIANQGFQEEGVANGELTASCSARYIPGAQ